MKKLLSGLCATAISMSFAMAPVVPANAAPVYVPPAVQASSDLVEVQSRHRADRRDRHDRRKHRIIRRGDNWYMNGHRGSRHYRHGYRRYGDFWFPAAAFLAGALITGAINNSTAVRPGSNAHIQWCYDRYRSYRHSDNTFQPYNGPRRQCYSPYS